MKTGFLLVNLGSPVSPRVKDVRRYLRQFLMDGRVIDVPYIVRKIIVEGFILPFRPKKSAEAYQSIWWKEGSPLVVISQRLKEKVQKNLDAPVALAMRYGNPSIFNGLNELNVQKVEKVIIFPLYPQYAMSTTETVVEESKRIAQKYFPNLVLEFFPPFYKDKDYIHLLAKSIKEHLPSEFDKLLFSYHGIPERHIFKTDKHGTCKIKNCCFKENLPSHDHCYRHQCYVTTERVGELLQLPKKKIYQSFQSRLGRDPWLTPYTDKTFENFPCKGVKKIAVVCPAFVSDCLETLEEIEGEGKEIFLHAGGEEFTYIPCLNDRDDWADLITKWCKSYLA